MKHTSIFERVLEKKWFIHKLIAKSKASIDADSSFLLIFERFRSPRAFGLYGATKKGPISSRILHPPLDAVVFSAMENHQPTSKSLSL